MRSLRLTSASRERQDARGEEFKRRGEGRGAEVGSAESVKHKVWSAGWESWADRLWGDAVYSLRRLGHAKALVLTVMVSIGLGIAANARSSRW